MSRKGAAPMLKRNVYVYNAVSEARHHAENKHIRERCERVQAVDPLGDFASFAQAVREFKVESAEAGDPLMWHGIANESLFYGHLRALAEYAGRPYNERDRLLLPAIEHGIAWVADRNPVLERPYVHNLVSQGAYRKGLSIKAGLPHYVIGPYVRYARLLHTVAEEAAAKEGLGRTVLVFPAHSYEGSSVSYQKAGFVERVMTGLGRDFDTVLVCAYWHDADDELFALFQGEGARVVSAGIRSDPLFISRLKTMLRLSDAVTGNALGTHIGYALAEGRRFYMANWDAPRIDDYANAYSDSQLRSMGAVEARVRRAFGAESPEGGDDLAAERRDIFRTYWGGEQAVRTPEEVGAMFEIGGDVLGSSRGFSSRFAASAEDALREYGRSTASRDKVKASLLAEALGRPGEARQ